MQEEFLHLKQGSLSVQDYHKRFMELARFAPVLVLTKVSKVEMFVAGLNLDTQMALVLFKFRTLSEAYSSAMDHYRVLSIRRAVQDRANRPGEGGGASDSKRHRLVGPGPMRNLHKGSASGGGTSRSAVGQGTRSDGAKERHFHCRRCGKDHIGRDCNGFLVKCFSCGQRGHRAFECASGSGGPSNPRPGGTGGAQTSTQPQKEAEGKDGSTLRGS
ncbi:uncharacterized protein LOC116009857 [Ipomoea triloba]|uniref:uncharacterized protein LOC116009857 n=1 Tax=Ipomoea triloba TaxID=35885 RepID=UPI00125E9776|nr:uncharacterized protein LOC116009857 [Ipomoea triloba]